MMQIYKTDLMQQKCFQVLWWMQFIFVFFFYQWSTSSKKY